MSLLETHTTQELIISGHVVRAIEESRWILDLRDDWDGEGASAYSRDTWQRATDFLKRCAARGWARFGLEIPAPEIGPGPDGSIDLHWNDPRERFVLLINIRRDGDPDGPAGFYGRNDSGTELKGKLNPDAPSAGLLEWLCR